MANQPLFSRINTNNNWKTEFVTTFGSSSNIQKKVQ